MKKIIVFFVFVTVFIVTFAIFSMGLKLSAEPMEYFIQSIKHMFWQKIIISFVTGSFAGGISTLIIKKKQSII